MIFIQLFLFCIGAKKMRNHITSPQLPTLAPFLAWGNSGGFNCMALIGCKSKNIFHISKVIFQRNKKTYSFRFSYNRKDTEKRLFIKTNIRKKAQQRNKVL